MGYAYRTHTYTSGPQEFPVNFTLGYISKQDVFVSVVGEVDGENNPVYRTFDWIDDDTIRVHGDLENGDVVKIQRVVSKQELAVDFNTSGSASRDSLNAGFKQVLMAIHELYDGVLADRALVTALPQDIENGLEFISDNAHILLTLENQDEGLWHELRALYTSIDNALARSSNYAALSVEGANKAIEQAAIAVSNAQQSITKAAEALVSQQAASASETASAASAASALENKNLAVSAKDITVAAKDVTVTKAAEVATNTQAVETNTATVNTKAAEVEANRLSTEQARDQALAAFANFNDVYLGAFSTDPTQDVDGSSLDGGELYFDTTNNAMKVYDGSIWRSAYVSAAGTLVAANNLSDVPVASTARSNLGLDVLYPVAHMFRVVNGRLKYKKQTGNDTTVGYADWTVMPKGVSFSLNASGHLIAVLPEIGG